MWSLPGKRLSLLLAFGLSLISSTVALNVAPPIITPGLTTKEFELKKRIASTCNNEICAADYTCTGPINGAARCCPTGSTCAIRSICTPYSVIQSLNSNSQSLNSDKNAIYCTELGYPHCNTYIYAQYDSISMVLCDSDIALGSKLTITGTFPASTSKTTSEATTSARTPSPSPTTSFTTPLSTSTSTPTPSSTSTQSPTRTPVPAGLPTGAVAGIAVGSTLVGIAAICAVIFLLRSKTSKSTAQTPAPSSQQYPGAPAPQQQLQQHNAGNASYGGYGVSPASPVPGSPPPQWSPGSAEMGMSKGWCAAPISAQPISEIGPSSK
ncbi:hypothetical protein BGZ60DRAFT_533469 [Tricladium varicosporioides]|nr:hypothetical protein BGZ60DRAFT_533469 [Hymenoscyphus varicosporioides]